MPSRDRGRWLVLVCVAFALGANRAEAACDPADAVAEVFDFVNSVQILAVGAASPRSVVGPTAVCVGERVVVGPSSRARLFFAASGETIVIDQNTEFVLLEVEDSRSVIEILRGALLFFTRGARALEVQTAFVNAAVEGTEFLVRVSGPSASPDNDVDRTTIMVFEGVVTASVLGPQGGLANINANQFTEVMRGDTGDPVVQEIEITIRPRDAVQWALYFEPILPQESPVQLSDQDPQFYVIEASGLLEAGQRDDADEAIGRALELEPTNAEAYALRTIIDVARNCIHALADPPPPGPFCGSPRQPDTPGALSNGREAVRLDGASVTARIAYSYALQADFRLQDALETLRELLESAGADQEPANGRGLARLAELWLSLGEFGRARDAAEKAVRLVPDLARAQTVLGFAELAQTNISSAREHFERAIALEPGAPLQRLGLGLTQIRSGNLRQGRENLVRAATLNPGDPTLRSYLGKAHFEAKDNSLAAREFRRARELDSIDPRLALDELVTFDPTPWFYDAIRKQTVNRPIEAFHDLERSIELNDNRAVYRSRFLLDQDLAARSASLGRVYRDLGFEQLALVEGWKSLDADPTDYSGHRLLADTYSVLPRHEIARASELLQAQLMQPATIATVAPSLAEVDLFLLQESGPTRVGFNEYNALFHRNRFAVQATSAIGKKSTLGDEVTASALWNNLSFTLGQFHYQTDGARENNAQERDIYNALVQFDLSFKTSVQAEFRSDQSTTGDLNLRFDPTDFQPDLDRSVDSSTTRFGIRHVLSPSSQLIGSVYIKKRDLALSESVTGFGPAPASQVTLSETDGYTAEARHTYAVGLVQLISGLSQFGASRDTDETTQFGPPLNFGMNRQISDDPEQTSVYLYSKLSMSPNLSLTAGASGDFYRRDVFEKNQFNPKFGVMWRPFSSATVRAAAFRTLHRPLVSSQTIEPTNIAGFNQFFADTEAEEAKNYGLALDQRLGRKAFAGLAYSWRNLGLPLEFREGDERVVRIRDRREQLGRSYLYWTFVDRLSVHFEYLYERFDREDGGSEAFLKLRTHRVPVGLRYFDPSGLFGHFEGTLVRQRGVFLRGSQVPGEDSFVVVDGSFGYRLPRRYGQLKFEIHNLFNEKFMFQDTDPANPFIRPGRWALLQLTVAVG